MGSTTLDLPPLPTWPTLGSSALGIALAAYLVTLGACSDSHRAGPCPCAYDWVCCPGERVCAASASLCPAADEETDAHGATTPPSPSPDDAPADGGRREAGGPADAAPQQTDGGGDADLQDARVPDAGAGPDHPPVEPCELGRFCWYWPDATGDDFRGIWGTEANDVWLTTETGSVLHFDGSELSLRYQHGEANEGGPLTGILPPDHDAGLWFPVGVDDRTEMIRLSSEGLFYRGLSNGPAPRIQAVTAPSARDGSVWAVGRDATLVGWAHWAGPGGVSTLRMSQRVVDTGLPAALDLVAVWASGKDDVWAMDRHGVAHQGSAEGTAWTEHADATHTSESTVAVGLGGAGAQDVWAIHESFTENERGVVFRHFDGDTWTRTVVNCAEGAYTYSSERGLPRVWSRATDDIWVSGNRFRCLWHWDGTAWTEYPAVRAREWRYNASVHQLPWSDGTTTLVAGERGSLARLNAEGAWTSLVDPGPRFVLALAALGDDELFAVFEHTVVHLREGEIRRLPEAVVGSHPMSLYALGARDLWVAGGVVGWTAYTGYMAHWNGDEWDQVERFEEPARIDATRGRELWVSFEGADSRHWDGNDWAALPDAIEGRVKGVATSDELTWYAVERDEASALLYRQEGDDAPTSLPFPFESREAPSLFAVGSELWTISGTPWHYDGSRWHARALPEEYGVGSAWGTQPNDLWFVGSSPGGGVEGRAAVLHWDGTSFQRGAEGTPGHRIQAISGTDRYLFVGANGVLRGVR